MAVCGVTEGEGDAREHRRSAVASWVDPVAANLPAVGTSSQRRTEYAECFTHLCTIPPSSRSSTEKARRVSHSSKPANSSNTPKSSAIVRAFFSGTQISTTVGKESQRTDMAARRRSAEQLRNGTDKVRSQRVWNQRRVVSTRGKAVDLPMVRFRLPGRCERARRRVPCASPGGELGVVAERAGRPTDALDPEYELLAQ